MTKSRRLADLGVRGKDVVFDDPGGPIKVWAQKLNPYEAEEMFRRAQAAKARVMTAKSEPDSDAYRAIQMQVLEFDDDVDTIIEFLLTPDRYTQVPIREAEVGARDAWSEDDRLQGLRDAWNDEVKATFEALPPEWNTDGFVATDPLELEAIRVHAELERFNAEVAELVDAELDSKRAELKDCTLEKLRDKLFDVLMDSTANSAWFAAYRKAEILLGVRDPDVHSKKYFAHMTEVNELQEATLARLIAEFEELRIDVTEGKDSEATPSSSPSPEPPAEASVEVSSSPLVAVQ